MRTPLAAAMLVGLCLLSLAACGRSAPTPMQQLPVDRDPVDDINNPSTPLPPIDSTSRSPEPDVVDTNNLFCRGAGQTSQTTGMLDTNCEPNKLLQQPAFPQGQFSFGQRPSDFWDLMHRLPSYYPASPLAALLSYLSAQYEGFQRREQIRQKIEAGTPFVVIMERNVGTIAAGRPYFVKYTKRDHKFLTWGYSLSRRTTHAQAYVYKGLPDHRISVWGAVFDFDDDGRIKHYNPRINARGYLLLLNDAASRTTRR